MCMQECEGKREQEEVQCYVTITFSSMSELIGIDTPIFVEFIVFGVCVGRRILEMI